MKVVICAIAKNEHLYINEWVNYYLKLGFDKIYLYDNDDLDAERVENFIDSDLLDRVEIVDYRGIKRHHLQHYVYDSFYRKQKDNFDWVFFVDIDEFLVGIDNIKDFLKNPVFRWFDQIRFKWRLFGDDNIVERDTTQPVFGAFTKVITNNPKSNQTKCMIRGGLQNILINSCHYVKWLNSCYPSGKPCSATEISLNNYKGEKIFVNHYMTKSLAEFVDQKLNRGDAVWEKRDITLDYFWQINEKTVEKIQFLENRGVKNEEEN